MIRFAPRRVVPRIRVVRIRRGPRGALETARMIREMIHEGARDFVVRQRAIRIFREYRVPGKDRLGEVRALLDWVRRHVRYTRDIHRLELLHSARRMLELRAGDCDDMTIVLCSMLKSTGHPVRLVLAGYQPERPHVYSHIYPEVNVQRKWLAIDPTLPFPIGWAPPAAWSRVYGIEEEEVA
jgi:transglutaminase-like putative cysteine protease